MSPFSDRPLVDKSKIGVGGWGGQLGRSWFLAPRRSAQSPVELIAPRHAGVFVTHEGREHCTREAERPRGARTQPSVRSAECSGQTLDAAGIVVGRVVDQQTNGIRLHRRRGVRLQQG